ncbi:hypothetical protein H0H87_002225 [Tephrocybe sp. NHM501043]|nr:hypothetical protein H0H87_002225 [Tephrocybe sp. NHM501043]
MHNGGIADFPSIKRKIQSFIPDDIFDKVQGNTDSEWAFALLLSKVGVMVFSPHTHMLNALKLEDPNAQLFTPEILRQAMLKTISQLNEIAKEAGIIEVCSIGMVISTLDRVIMGSPAS